MLNVYEEIGLKRVVNASGRMTILGVSTLSDEVAQAAIAGGQSYVVIEDLIDKAGEIISRYTGGEAGEAANVLRPWFDGGSDDRKDHCAWDEGSTRSSFVNGRRG